MVVHWLFCFEDLVVADERDCAYGFVGIADFGVHGDADLLVEAGRECAAVEIVCGDVGTAGQGSHLDAARKVEGFEVISDGCDLEVTEGQIDMI